MNNTLQTYGGYRLAHTGNDGNPPKSQMDFRHALRTLRAIRQRYATGCASHPGERFYSVLVPFGSGDMFWLTAAIESLEKTIAGGATEAAGAAAEAGPET